MHENRELEDLGISAIVAIPRAGVARLLAHAAHVAGTLVELPRAYVEQGGLPVAVVRTSGGILQQIEPEYRLKPRLDLRFSVDKELVGGIEFAAISIFGQLPEDGSDPQEIILNPEYPDLPITFLHDVGHAIDYYGVLEERGFATESASTTTGLFACWGAAIRCTSAYRQLGYIIRACERDEELTLENRETGQYLSLSKGIPSLEILNELHSEHEWWGRAFAQYVVFRSHDPKLSAMFERVRSKHLWSVLGLQWSDEEFAPIAEEMDILFDRLSILKLGRKRL